MTKKDIRKQAKIIKKRIDGDVTYQSLLNYVRQRGITVLTFNEGKQLIKKAALSDFAVKANSFIYVNGDVVIIFIDDRKDKLLLLAHEYGHYLLGHNINNATIEQENEANLFAELLLSNKEKTIKTIIVTALVTAIVVTGLLGIAVWRKSDRIDPPSTKPTLTEPEEPEEPEETEEIYIVTKSGEKYHLPDCQYVRYKTNTISLTLDEAIKLGYEPCSVCIGE